MATRGQKIAAGSAAAILAEPLITAAHLVAPAQAGVGVIASLAAGAIVYHLVGDLVPGTGTGKDAGESVLSRLWNGRSVREKRLSYEDYLQTPEWQSTRKRILARDRHRCRDCDAEGIPLDVHHLTYERLGHEQDDDLLSLCRACHDKRHGRGQQPEPMEELQPRPAGVSRLDFGADEELVLPPVRPTGPFLFSQILQGFTPTLQKIYLATLDDGRQIFCSAEDLCHVALAGATRGGKSSILRMLAAQLCYAGASVLILNPHHARYIHDKQEDWTPFERYGEKGRPYLLYDPMGCRQYETIAHFLRQIVETKLPERREKVAYGRPPGRPYFLILDELPAIVKHVKEASGWLDDLVREGAKYNLFVITAAQDFLVKTLKLESGEMRECFHTCYFVGGGGTTGSQLLDIPARLIPETDLGAGTVMLRNWKVCKDARIAFVPLVDNEALYTLLGPSTYVPAGQTQEADEEDDLVSSLVSGQSAERETDPTLPSRCALQPMRQRVRQTQSSYDAYQQRRAARKQPVYAREPAALQATSNPESSLSDDERRVLEAYRAGAKTGMAIKSETGIPGTRINECLHRLARLGLIDWQPRQK